MFELLKKLLSSQTETEILEFKSASKQYDSDKLGKYFSALSNEANLNGQSVAYLVIGVNDKKEIIGTNISDKKLNYYKQEIANHTSPTLTFRNIHTVQTDYGNVIVFEIPATPQGMPVAWKGHYYARNGESLTALNIEKVERIRQQQGIYDWSMQIIPNATVDDLSQEAIVFARQKFAEKNPQLFDEIPKWDDTTFLNKAKICIKGKITNTAIVLLGKPESEHFISPAVARITWILKDKGNLEKDYQHFSCPFLLTVSEVANKIRNLKYRYIKDGTLFPDEVDQYNPFILREALNNCIAHQDYTKSSKINVIENEDGFLSFVNAGDFMPQSVEQVVEADAPTTVYRNPFLANAMVNLNMIDTIGSGIKRMFVIQKDKYFPLPDYDFSNQQVAVKIIGKVMDLLYARKLVELNDLSLSDIILLDKVSKNKAISADEAKQLRNKRLIEGRKPNYIISAKVAAVTNEKASYIKQRGLNDDYYMKLVIDYLHKFKQANRSDIDKILLDKLPDVLDDKQKYNKIKNLLQKLRQTHQIVREHNYWVLNKESDT